MRNLLFSALAILVSLTPVAKADFHVYFGTYTNNSDSEGIYRSVFDSETGELEYTGKSIKVIKPVSPDPLI